ncbi:MAG: hypothetical protein ACREU2_08920 [Steroidobacteraceae bacterium]
MALIAQFIEIDPATDKVAAQHRRADTNQVQVNCVTRSANIPCELILTDRFEQLIGIVCAKSIGSVGTGKIRYRAAALQAAAL